MHWTSQPQLLEAIFIKPLEAEGQGDGEAGPSSLVSEDNLGKMVVSTQRQMGAWGNGISGVALCMEWPLSGSEASSLVFLILFSSSLLGNRSHSIDL